MSTEQLLAIREGALSASLNYNLSHEDAEDTAQDVVCCAIDKDRENRIHFESLTKARAWGARCARNLIIDRQRKRKITLICYDFVRAWDFI